MYSTHIRQVGGSLMLSLPPAVLELFQLKTGSKVDLIVENNTLLVKPHAKKKYSMKELLAQCDADASLPSDNQEWLSASPVGKELI